MPRIGVGVSIVRIVSPSSCHNGPKQEIDKLFVLETTEAACICICVLDVYLYIRICITVVIDIIMAIQHYILNLNFFLVWSKGKSRWNVWIELFILACQVSDSHHHPVLNLYLTDHKLLTKSSYDLPNVICFFYLVIA